MATGRVVVRVVRSGGVAGFVRRYEVDSESLDPGLRAELDGLLAAADFEAGPPAPPPGADRFQYDVEVERGASVCRVTAYDGAVPPALGAVCDWVLEHSH